MQFLVWLVTPLPDNKQAFKVLAKTALHDDGRDELFRNDCLRDGDESQYVSIIIYYYGWGQYHWLTHQKQSSEIETMRTCL